MLRSCPILQRIHAVQSANRHPVGARAETMIAAFNLMPIGKHAMSFRKIPQSGGRLQLVSIMIFENFLHFSVDKRESRSINIPMLNHLSKAF
jgi:hypothetical protein